MNRDTAHSQAPLASRNCLVVRQRCQLRGQAANRVPSLR
jgi:hypothetical protein